VDNSKRMTALAIAGAAAAMFVMGVPSASAADDGTVKVRCYGANSCKGQAECKTAMNSCKGHNSCKGKGFVMMSEKACLEHFGRQ